MIYEFITPSDPITFEAEDPKVAFACALILGNGQAGAESETGVKLPTILLFADENTVKAAVFEFLGEDLDTYIKAHTRVIAECFDSFAYVRLSSRKEYNDAIELITEPQKLEEFRKRHEDRQRTSMSRWVQAAWNWAAKFRGMETNPKHQPS